MGLGFWFDVFQGVCKVFVCDLFHFIRSFGFIPKTLPKYSAWRALPSLYFRYALWRVLAPPLSAISCHVSPRANFILMIFSLFSFMGIRYHGYGCSVKIKIYIFFDWCKNNTWHKMSGVYNKTMDQIIKILLKHCTCGLKGKCRTCQYLIDEEKEVTDELHK